MRPHNRDIKAGECWCNKGSVSGINKHHAATSTTKVTPEYWYSSTASLCCLYLDLDNNI